MANLMDAADHVARDFLTGKRPPDEFHVAVTRNAILDCLLSSPEPDFIAKVCADKLVGPTARRVIHKVAPHLVQLAGQTLEGARA